MDETESIVPCPDPTHEYWEQIITRNYQLKQVMKSNAIKRWLLKVELEANISYLLEEAWKCANFYVPTSEI